MCAAAWCRVCAALLLGLGATLWTQAGTLGTSAPLRPGAESTVRVTSARSLYVLHCSGCHGLDGRGALSQDIPDLRQLGMLLMMPQGRSFALRVPGVMGAGLTDADIARVMNWILESFLPVGQARHMAPYTDAEVSMARQMPLVDVVAARKKVLEPVRPATATR